MKIYNDLSTLLTGNSWNIITFIDNFDDEVNKVCSQKLIKQRDRDGVLKYFKNMIPYCRSK